MNKTLFGVLMTVTLISASLYDRLGVNAANRMAIAPRAAAPATPIPAASPMTLVAQASSTPAPAPVAAVLVADSLIASDKPVPALAPAAPALSKAVVSVKSTPSARDSWIVPPAAPATGTILPANFPPPAD